MDSTDVAATTENLAGRAFEQLRGEVSLMRRGVEALTAERQAAPDHGPALADIIERLETLTSGIDELVEQPALKLTPLALAQQIERAGEQARRRDEAIIDRAGKVINNVAARIDQTFARVDTEREQVRRRRVWTCSALLCGMALIQGANDLDRALRAAQPATAATVQPASQAPRQVVAPETAAPPNLTSHRRHRRTRSAARVYGSVDNLRATSP